MSEAENITAPISWAARADAEGVADHIAAIISQSGDHWLAVPGGKTPLPSLIFSPNAVCHGARCH